MFLFHESAPAAKKSGALSKFNLVEGTAKSPCRNQIRVCAAWMIVHTCAQSYFASALEISGFSTKLLYAVAYVCRGPFGISRLLGLPLDGTDATKRVPPVAALRGSGFHGSLDPLRPGAHLRLLQATEGNVKDR